MTVWPRYIFYFLGITLITWFLTRLEINFPGSLKLHVFAFENDTLGTSEYSPVEVVQPMILLLCGLLLAWVAQNCPSQRPIAFPCSGLALAFMIRECDYFLDRFLIDNFWQFLIAIVLAVVIAFTYRARRRLRVALGRIWPSPGLALWFAGGVILFAFVHLVGHEPLWRAISGDHYQRVVKLAVEEFAELLGYFLWLIGTIEYTYQSRAIAYREPQPAARRRRQKRRQDKQGSY